MNKQPAPAPIDFTKIAWDTVDREKAEFFYSEALEYNRQLVENINSLNSKAYALLGLVLAVLAAAAGWLLQNMSAGGPERLSAALVAVCACTGLSAVCFIAAVWNRGIYFAEGKPDSYLAQDFYKQDFTLILRSCLAAAHKAIMTNTDINESRGKMIKAAICFFIATPAITILIYYFWNFGAAAY